ncbi:hypothetical protein AURDEDRAFT_166870 [Auricularia subglabra TFB-10046 SS5]|nr:hypothetical protein AURDEDRAFT_166870 [Auricularia subglabra TFB-10046 SS5]
MAIALRPHSLYIVLLHVGTDARWALLNTAANPERDVWLHRNGTEDANCKQLPPFLNTYSSSRLDLASPESICHHIYGFYRLATLVAITPDVVQGACTGALPSGARDAESGMEFVRRALQRIPVDLCVDLDAAIRGATRMGKAKWEQFVRMEARDVGGFEPEVRDV